MTKEEAAALVASHLGPKKGLTTVLKKVKPPKPAPKTKDELSKLLGTERAIRFKNTK